MARALGGDERDVDLRRGLHFLVVDAEAVAEHQEVAGGDPVLDRLLPDVMVLLVGEQDHHDVAEAGGLFDARDLQAGGLGVLDRFRALAKAYDDIYPGILEVAGVGVALRAVAKDGHGLALQEVQVCVVVVIHGGRSYAVAVATHVRAGMIRLSSACRKGSAAFSRSARTSLRVAKSICLSASPVRVDIWVCVTHQSSTSS